MSRSISHLFTRRWKNRRNWYDDTKRMRCVVHRRHGDIERKTSIRYREESHHLALALAESEAGRLRAWPANKLAAFKFAA